MDTLTWLGENGSRLFHLSMFDWAIAFCVVAVTFCEHLFKMLRIVGALYLEFLEWRMDFTRRCDELKRAGHSRS
jgi:hypothetical protein